MEKQERQNLVNSAYVIAEFKTKDDPEIKSLVEALKNSRIEFDRLRESVAKMQNELEAKRLAAKTALRAYVDESILKIEAELEKESKEG